MVKFAVVTDIHYGLNRANKKGKQAPALVDRFVRIANKKKMDFAVDLGDRVTTTALDEDKKHLTNLKQHFNALAMPKYSVHGNHDLHRMSRTDNEQILGVPAVSHAQNIKGFTFVFWNPEIRSPGQSGFNVPFDDMEWLKDALAAATGPCVVFSHIPLDNTEEDNRQAHMRDGIPHASFYPQGAQIRKIMEESGKVFLCMAGHRHRNRHQEINGIHYITQQSLVQNHPTKYKARGAFSLVEVLSDAIKIRGYGMGQPSYQLKRA